MAYLIRHSLPGQLSFHEACRHAGPYFFVYGPANFALRSGQKTLAKPRGQSYNPTNLKRKMLPVLGW